MQLFVGARHMVVGVVVATLMGLVPERARATSVLTQDYTSISMATESGDRLELRVEDSMLHVGLVLGSRRHGYRIPLLAAGLLAIEETSLGWDASSGRRFEIVSTAVPVVAGEDIVLHQYKIWLEAPDYRCEATVFDPVLNATSTRPCWVADAGKAGASGLDCDAFPQFPPLKTSRVGTDTLVSLLEIHAPQEYLLAVRRAAQALEDDLAAGSIADVEAAFYRHQVSALSALCDPDADGDREIPAVVLIERIAGALIHAAQLREAPGEEVRKILPSRLDNLTAAGNVVSLAAGCSRVNHARLARKLQGMGLPCGP